MSVSNQAPGATSSPATMPVPAAGLSRGNLVLLGLLLIQLALSVYLFWPGDQVSTGGEPLLANLSTGAVTQLTISDNSDGSVSFTKEGDVWTLAGTDGYPARADKITQTLDKLAAIATDRLVTQTAGSHDRLQVADNNFVRKVEITTADGTQTLYFGTSSGVSATHVRAANSDATYITSEVATWELDTLTTTWIEVAYYQVPKEQIQEVTLQNANGTFTLVRDSAAGEAATGGEWTLADAQEGEPVAPANINTLIDRIATLNLQSVLGKSEAAEYGLDAPLATVTVTTSETTTGTTEAATKTTTLLIGAKDEESNSYVLKSSDSEFYVRLAAFTGDELVNSQRSDFLVNQPPDDATAPAVDATGVTTATTDIEDQSAATSTLPITGTAPLTSTEALTEPVDGEPGVDAGVDAAEVTTGTADTGDE